MNDIQDDEAATQAAGQFDDDSENSEENFVSEVCANLADARKSRAEWRKQAKEDYDFYSGRQWNEQDAAKLSEEGRPVIVFNRTMRTINAVSGLERQNRQEVRYLPREMADGGASETLTNASKWVRDTCNAEAKDSRAFKDCCICGEGWTETRMDYETDPEGLIIVDRISPLEILFDPTCKEDNFADAKWVAHVKDFTKKEVKELWPDAEIELSKFWNDSEGTPHNADEDIFYKNDQSDKMARVNTISIVRYQYWERYVTYQVLSADGNLVELPKEKFEKLRRYIELQQMRYVKQTRRKYKQCFIAGKKLLEPAEELGCDHFTIQGISGLHDETKNQWFGLIRPMRDPQMWANKWLSQILHIVNSSAKNGYFVEEDAIANISKFEENNAKPGSITAVRPGALASGKIQPKDAPQYPQGIDRLLQYAVQAITDVTGVSMELMGMADRDQPIGLEESRKQAGISILAPFFDSLHFYRQRQGRVLAYFIKEYIADGRLIRIVGETGAQYVPLLKDELTYKYDIIVDDAPTSPNMKERTFAILNQILPMAMQAGIPIPPDLLDHMPLPDSLIQKWKKFILDNQANPMEDQLKQIKMMLAQIEVEKAQADVQKTASEITMNYAKAEQAQAISQDESAQAMQKMGMANAEQQIKEEQILKEAARKDLEMMLNHKRKMIETQLNAQIKARQATTKA